MEFLRRYGIVIVALALSVGAFFAGRWIQLGLVVALNHATPPCSNAQAWRGLVAMDRTASIAAKLAGRCSILSIDSAGFEHVDTPEGTYWVPQHNDAVTLPTLVAEQQSGIYASDETPIRPNDIILDGGANVGVFTRAALRAGAGLVVAIEPAPKQIECLRRNFRAEIAAGRVIVYPKGLWNEDAVLPMHLDAFSAADSFFTLRPNRDKGTINLPLTTIDKLTSELHLPRVDYIKLDIEGAEVQAIHGATSVLSRFRPRFAASAEHHVQDSTDIPRAVLAANPTYRVACGACSLDQRQIRPEVIRFY